MANLSARLLLATCLVLALSQASGQSVRDLLAKKVKEMQSPVPNGVVCGTCIVTRLQHRNTGHRSDNFPVSELNSRLSSYPAGSRNILQTLSVADESNWSDFKVSQSQGQVVVTYYDLVGKKVNDRLHVGALNTDIVATTPNRKLSESEMKLAMIAINAEAAKVFTATLSRINV